MEAGARLGAAAVFAVRMGVAVGEWAGLGGGPGRRSPTATVPLLLCSGVTEDSRSLRNSHRGVLRWELGGAGWLRSPGSAAGNLSLGARAAEKFPVGAMPRADSGTALGVTVTPITAVAASGMTCTPLSVWWDRPVAVRTRHGRILARLLGCDEHRRQASAGNRISSNSWGHYIQWVMRKQISFVCTVYDDSSLQMGATWLRA